MSASSALDSELSAIYRQAQEFLRAGNEVAAAPLLEKVVAGAPEHPEAHLLLGYTHYRESLVQLGGTSVDYQRLDRAEKLFQRAWQLEPSAECAYHIGLALERRKSLELAREWFQQALELDRDHVAARQRLGVAEFHLGRLEEAREAFSGVLSRDPQHSGAWHQLGLVTSELGELELAREQLSRAVELEPEDSARLFDLSAVLRRAGAVEEADAMLADFERRQSGGAPASAALADFALGKKAIDQGRWEPALAAFEAALQRDAEHFPSLLGAGGAALQLGHVEQATGYYRRAVRRKPGDAFAHFQLGRVLVRAQSWNGASEALAQAVELAPDEARYHSLLASALLGGGELERARGPLDRALALAPGDLRSRMNRALLLEQVGEKEAAVRDLRAVLAAKSDFPGAYEALRRLGG